MICYVLLAGLNEQAFHTLNPIALAIGAYLPDCDHRHAPAGKFLPMWLFVKHRGTTHTIYAVIFVGLLGWWLFGWKFGFSLSLGYLLHLAMDASTPMGVKWF